jgi:O-antigen/teichoic acid export membrane protein
MSLARYTVYNLVGALTPAVTALVTIPLYLHVIGVERYGILAICWLLVGYFAFFDLGLGRALAQKIETLVDAPDERNRIFWSAISLGVVLSAIAALVFIPISIIGFGAMKLPGPELRDELNRALPLIVALVPFGILYNLLYGSLHGRKLFLRLNAIASVGAVATAVFPLVLAHLVGPQLTIIIAGTLLARALILAALAGACIRGVPLRSPELASRTEIRRLVSFGGWTTMTNVFGPMLTFLDRFAIGAIIGAAAVTLYVVPFSLVSQLMVVPMALATTLLPHLAAMPRGEAVTLCRNAARVLLFVATPLTLVAIVLIEPFLVLWVGPIGHQSAPLAYPLLLGFWATSMAQVPSIFLPACGRPDLLAKLHAAEVIPYAVLLVAGLHFWGVFGAALAWCVRGVVDAALLFFIQTLDTKTWRLLGLHAVVVAAGAATMLLVTATGELRWVLMSFNAIAALFLLLTNIPPEVVSRVRPYFGSAARKLDR